MNREYVTADIAVFGGSLAGFATAITAKEQNPELKVLVVEKYFSGYAGKANRGGGVFIWFDPREGQNPEWMNEFHVHRVGRFLNNQPLMMKFWNNVNDTVEDMKRWTGDKFLRDENGEYVTANFGKIGFGWSLVHLDLDYLLEMRKYALKLGIKILDRVGLVDVLTEGGRCVGAIGYHIENGTQYVIRANATVIATGSQNYRNAAMWSPARGEGIAAAWRAGAELTNCEFGNFFQWGHVEHIEPALVSEHDMEAPDGMRIGTGHRGKYDPDVESGSLAEWYIQSRKGNSPIHLLPPKPRPNPFLIKQIRPFQQRFRGSFIMNDAADRTTNDVFPYLIGEMGPIKVGDDFMTSIPGLFAAGDACYIGSRVAGAVPAPPGRIRGSGLGFAAFSGRMAGRSTADFAAGKELGEVSEEQLNESAQRMMLPLSREGGCSPRDISYEVQRIMGNLGYALYMKEDRLRKALENVERVKGRLKVMSAPDMHGAFAANEAVSALLCTELFLRAALLRKESRGWFRREDYPEESDEMLKWFVARNEDGEIRFTEEPIPIDQYPFQPRPDDRNE